MSNRGIIDKFISMCGLITNIWCIEISNSRIHVRYANAEFDISMIYSNKEYSYAINNFKKDTLTVLKNKRYQIITEYTNDSKDHIYFKIYNKYVPIYLKCMFKLISLPVNIRLRILKNLRNNINITTEKTDKYEWRFIIDQDYIKFRFWSNDFSMSYYEKASDINTDEEREILNNIMLDLHKIKL